MTNNIFCPSNSQIMEKNLDIRKPCYSKQIFVGPLAIQSIYVPLYDSFPVSVFFALHFTKKLVFFWVTQGMF